MAGTIPELARLRLRNQWIDVPARADPAAVVKRLVAVQSQDFAGAKWALGLRLQDADERKVEQAFNAGMILRTHILRPTWHFVLPEDIRWLLDLTAPRVLALNAGMQRKAGLDAATFRKAEQVMARALGGGRPLTRDELRAQLEGAGLNTQHEFRFAYLLMHAELKGLICSGPRRGKQFTYALLDERAPVGRARSREQALTELARRYFISRGPATPHDLAKWSGLTLADARQGLEASGGHLQHESIEGTEYWFGPPVPSVRNTSQAHLLSVYDEYFASYKGHSVIGGDEISRRLRLFGNALTGIVIVDGMVVGTWKRGLTPQTARVEIQLLRRITPANRKAILLAAQRYARFHDVQAALSWVA